MRPVGGVLTAGIGSAGMPGLFGVRLPALLALPAALALAAAQPRTQNQSEVAP